MDRVAWTSPVAGFTATPEAPTGPLSSTVAHRSVNVEDYSMAPIVPTIVPLASYAVRNTSRRTSDSPG